MVTRLGLLAAAAAAVLSTGVSVVQAAPLLAVDYNSPSTATESGFSGVSTNALTTIGSYTVSSVSGIPWHSGGGPALTYMPDLYVDVLFSTDQYWNTAPIDVTLGGFTSGTQYELTFYSYNNAGGAKTINYYQTGSPSTIIGAVSWDAAVVPTAGNPYSTTFNLTADGSGKLYVSCTLVTGSSGGPVINGFTVSEVPEPASIALLGLGSLALLRRKRQARA